MINLILVIEKILVDIQPKEEIKERIDCDNYFEFRDKIIILRPYVYDFVDFVVNKYNISIWTELDKGTAVFILRKLFKKNFDEIKFLFFNYHCNLCLFMRGHNKAIYLLWEFFDPKVFSKHNTVVIDSCDETKYYNSDNCIMIKKYSYLNKKDTVLSSKNKLLNSIKKMDEYIVQKEKEINLMDALK